MTEFTSPLFGYMSWPFVPAPTNGDANVGVVIMVMASIVIGIVYGVRWRDFPNQVRFDIPVLAKILVSFAGFMFFIGALMRMSSASFIGFYQHFTFAYITLMIAFGGALSVAVICAYGLKIIPATFKYAVIKSYHKWCTEKPRENTRVVNIHS